MCVSGVGAGAKGVGRGHFLLSARALAPRPRSLAIGGLAGPRGKRGTTPVHHPGSLNSPCTRHSGKGCAWEHPSRRHHAQGRRLHTPPPHLPARLCPMPPGTCSLECCAPAATQTPSNPWFSWRCRARGARGPSDRGPARVFPDRLVKHGPAHGARSPGSDRHDHTFNTHLKFIAHAWEQRMGSCTPGARGIDLSACPGFRRDRNRPCGPTCGTRSHQPAHRKPP